MWRFATCCLLLFGLQQPVAGFDTGHHKDMTIAALRKEGFSDDAIRVVVLQNWIVDWYSAHGASDKLLPLLRRLGSEGVMSELVQNHDDYVIVFETSYLHFDNLNKWQHVDPTSGAVTNVSEYWTTLADATTTAIHERLRAKDPDVLAILSLLGISLHAVQDFYAHSNWVDSPAASAGAYDVTTWWDLVSVSPSPRRVTDAFTGSYGKHPQGITHDELNKDNYTRPNWDRAYTAAYWATRQWIRGFKAVVERDRPGFWAQCVQRARVLGHDSEVLDDNLQSSYVVSEYTGKWKGGPENDLFRTIFASYKYRDEGSIFRAAFNEQYVYAPLSRDLGHKEIRRGLSEGLNHPTFPKISPDEDAVMLVIPEVKNQSTATFFDNRMFAKIRMSVGSTTQEFRENTEFGNSGDKPFPWKVLFFVPKNADSVRVEVSLYNEGEGSHDQDQHIRIGDDNGGFDFSFEFHPSQAVCVLHGNESPCSRSAPLIAHGSSGHRAALKLYLERSHLTQTP